MPRVLPSEMAKAARIHPLLPKLMGVCRTVNDAKRELQWLEDEVLRIDQRHSFRLLQGANRFPFRPLLADGRTPRKKWEKLLLQKFVEERAKGTPLQLVVGSFP